MVRNHSKRLESHPKGLGGHPKWMEGHPKGLESHPKALEGHPSSQFPAGNCCVLKTSLGKSSCSCPCCPHGKRILRTLLSWLSWGTPISAFKSFGQPLDIRLDFCPYSISRFLFPTHFTGILLLAICFKVASFHVAVSKPEWDSKCDRPKAVCHRFYETCESWGQQVLYWHSGKHSGFVRGYMGGKSVKEFPVTHTFMYWNKLWNDQHLNIKVSNAEVPQCLLKYNLWYDGLNKKQREETNWSCLIDLFLDHSGEYRDFHQSITTSKIIQVCCDWK